MYDTDQNQMEARSWESPNVAFYKICSHRMQDRKESKWTKIVMQRKLTLSLTWVSSELKVNDVFQIEVENGYISLK